uniref:Uncharacterized protein n=1 Tax=Globodera pallida TaxID=36090 RepID=A0A183C6L2_GLOPA
MHFLQPFCSTILVLTLLIIMALFHGNVQSAVRHRREWLVGARGAGGADLVSIGSGDFWSLFGRRRMAPPPPPKGNAQISGKENADEQQQESEVPEWAQNDVFGFQPNRLGREWPPNPAQPEDIQLGHANKHKTLGDLDWLAGPAEAVPVREQVPLRGKLNAQWPPPEKEYRVELLLPEGVKQ